ncbi:MlaA family lipoprotein [Shimia abyssi]|uniref:Phospholipid-binding lipoprotein MlaA n=1 Tax=Shimia abyssi TaxID=1662395 RepID=A0A2P8FHW0_9RHOB|nr:VacJ family lipoprotein [Shimia abyssi]PSL21260.1 phospholipid-binding lipoprotein MlaA [Shimia abyssi]
MSSRKTKAPAKLGRSLLLCAVLALSACASNDQVSRTGIYDPKEDANRKMHEFNKDVDRYLFSPASNGYGFLFPQPVRNSFSRFADHLSLPNDVINHTLQGDLEEAVGTTWRFLINSTVGIAGFFDPASAIDIPRDDTDFGETLHVWGVQEGAYVELPFFGPSTSRDTVGLMADIALNPFVVIFRDPTQYIGVAAYVVDAMGNRYDFDDTIDSILYESADSYAQARILYLQNRRFDLGISGEDIYTDPEFNPYEDPYEDF